MTLGKPGVVLDAMVFLQAVVNENGPAARLFNLPEELNRPEIRVRFPCITDLRVGAFFKRLSRESVMINQVQKVFEYPRGPKDGPYINLAVAAGADYIITHDKDLQDLMTGYTTEAKEFRQKFRPLKVIDPVGFLKIFAPVNP